MILNLQALGKDIYVKGSLSNTDTITAGHVEINVILHMQVL